jgi:hypothetical protein
LYIGEQERQIQEQKFVELFFGIRGTKMKLSGNKTNIKEQNYLWG